MNDEIMKDDLAARTGARSFSAPVSRESSVHLAPLAAGYISSRIE